MRAYSRRFLFVAVILLCCVGCDQVTKSAAKVHLSTSRPISYLGDTFRLHYMENKGAFLNLGSTLPAEIRFWLLIVLTGIPVVAMFVLALIQRGLAPVSIAGLSLIIGGGIGNLIDRIANNGAVIDFLNIGINGLRTGIFNIADVAIMTGTGMLLFISLRSGKLNGLDFKGEAP